MRKRGLNSLAKKKIKQQEQPITHQQCSALIQMMSCDFHCQQECTGNCGPLVRSPGLNKPLFNSLECRWQATRHLGSSLVKVTPASLST